jgi:hypothetical protein
MDDIPREYTPGQVVTVWAESIERHHSAHWPWLLEKHARLAG